MLSPDKSFATNMMRLHLIWFWCVCAGLTLATRQKYNFNPGWRVLVGDPADAQSPSFDDKSWRQVTLPYAWNEDEAFHVGIEALPTGIAWYRKKFRVPCGRKTQKVFLEFEGIRQAGRFYLNGQEIGLHENGVMAFGFDVTEAIFCGKDNVLAARIDNDWDYVEEATGVKYQWQDKNFNANYGGINKNVYLHVTDTLYQTLPLYSNLGTTGTYIYARDIDVSAKSATIVSESQVKNDGTASKSFSYRMQILEMDGTKVKEFTSKPVTLAAGQNTTVKTSGSVQNLKLWSWGFGALYDVRTTLTVNGIVVDAVTTRTGFRKTEFAEGMTKLNDRVIFLKGYAQRSTNEWPALGGAIPAWLSDFSNNLVTESNGNLIRWMHITPAKQDIESCDRVGVIQALPAGDAEADTTGRKWAQRVEVMRDSIIYNRNNPSVLFYESGNNGISEEHMTEMKGVRDRYDPHGGRAIGSRDMLDSEAAEYGGEMLYINKGKDIPYWQMEYSRDEGLRKWWDNWSPPFHQDGSGAGQGATYNRNQDSHAVENVVRWFDYWEQRPGTGTRVNGGGANIIFSDTNTHYRGSENYRRSGEVDAMRLPKDGFYAHKIMWNGWVDVEQHGAHIIGHWNYNTTTTKPVYVVSSADEVELFLNGKSLGFGKQSYEFLFTFSNVTWEHGELRAVGYVDDTEVASTAKSSAGVPTAIKLTPHVSPAGFKATGADIALVDVEIVDKKGKRCPTALDSISFQLEGEAKWRGGLAQGSDNFILATTLPVENGVNRVMLRSTTKAGKVRLTASADGLASATLTLKTTGSTVTHGLSTVLPANDLPSLLTRGPTPGGVSYKVTRLQREIKAASASHSGVEASYDDNENSGWVSSVFKLSPRQSWATLANKAIVWNRTG